uniref:DUF4314 domain-containing protein n=1 Tax=Amycolatopsis sp. CA-096443 TaxID=3239919 RepID=UPI003F496D84
MDEFTKGQRVKLVHTSDEHTDLKPGAKGSFRLTDSAGTHHVQWDSGSRLGIVPDAGDEIVAIAE